MNTATDVVPFNLANLVNSSLINGSPYEGLREILSQTRTRSWRERLVMHAKISAYEFSGAVIDLRQLFAMKEAWKQSPIGGYSSKFWSYPRVGMACIKQDVAAFVNASNLFGFAKLTMQLAGARGHDLREIRRFKHKIALDYKPVGMDIPEGAYGAAVPFIPKKHAPFIARDKHAIMFDVEQWTKLREPQSFDPYILERIDEHKWKVLSHWDLTEAERRLMALAVA